MKNILYIISIISVVIIAESCKHEIPEPIQKDPIDTIGNDTTGNDTTGTDTTGGGTNCDPNIVYFQQQILPILVSSCGVPGCHDAPRSNNREIQITSYNSLMNSDEAWDDSNPLDTEFWDVIEDGEMPQPSSGISLSAEQRNLIFRWLQQGAQDNSCEPSPNNCDTTNVSFSQQVMPIINTHCKGCHSGSSPQSGILLTDYNAVKNVASQQRNNTSLLYGVVSHAAGFKNMPYNQAKISDCKIATIKSWIDNGMPNN